MIQEWFPAFPIQNWIIQNLYFQKSVFRLLGQGMAVNVFNTSVTTDNLSRYPWPWPKGGEMANKSKLQSRDLTSRTII